MHWYTMKRSEGIRVLPMEGWSRTPLRPKYSETLLGFLGVCRKAVGNVLRVPMKGLASSAKANEKPQKNHCKNVRTGASMPGFTTHLEAHNSN